MIIAISSIVRLASAESTLSPHDPATFELLLENNLDQHPEIRAFQKEIEAARIRSEEAFWLGDTRISIARTRGVAPLESWPGAQTEYGITQNFIWPGKSHSLTRIAEIEVDRTKIEFAKKRRQIEKETALLYSQLLNLVQKANIARQKMVTLSAAKKITVRNVRSGLGVPLNDNLIEREIELTQLQMEQLGLEQTQKISEIETKFPGVKIRAPEAQRAAIPRSYFERRSGEGGNLSLRTFSLDLDRTLADASLRRQSVWPDFALNLTRRNENAYDLTLGLTIPLWYPFRHSKQIASATEMGLASELRLDFQKQVAPLTETLLRTKIQILKRQIEGRRRIFRKISEATLKQSRTFFERGRIDWRQLQLAVDAVFQDQETIVDLDLALFVSQLDLYELLGVIE